MKLKYFYSKIKFLSSLLVLMLMLNARASNPRHVIIAPTLDTAPAVSHSNKQAQVNVIDMRTANHIVQIMREGKAATLISAQERLESTIENSLRKHWQVQGLILNNSANNKINISIEKAIINVEQTYIKYKVQTEIVVKVTVDNGSQTLTNTFTNRGNSNGPLQADIAVLERDFNQSLANLLQKILSSSKINNALN